MNYKNYILKNSYLKLFLFFLTLLAYFRSPFIFNNGRFFSADLNYHLLSNELNFIDAITFVDYSARYINLISNISSIISSRFFDLNYAQYVSVYLSFFIYLCIFYKILFKDSYFFKKSYQKYLGSLLCLIAPVLNFEIWLNAINLQVYFGLLTFIILFLKEKENNRFNIVLLLIGGLSGIYSCLFTPFFLVKYLINKKLSNLINFFVLLICSLIQLYLIFYVSMQYNPVGSDQSNTSLTFIINKFEIISFFYNVIIRSFFGSAIPTYVMGLIEIDLYNVLHNEIIRSKLFYFTLLLLSIFVYATYYFLNFIVNKEDKIIYFFLLLIFPLISLVVIFGGDTQSLHGRYSSLAGMVIIFGVLHLSNSVSLNWIRFFCIALIFSTIFTGLLDYRMKKYIYYLDCINCPDWKIEVKKYKSNNDYKLNAWPYHIDR